MERAKCLHCGHEWNKRVDIPKECPNCRRYYWHREKKKQGSQEKEIDKEIKQVKQSIKLTPPEL